MVCDENELEEQFLEAGNVLLQPLSSPSELLSHLDRVEKLLGKVEQSPSKSMFDALSPIIKAVVEEELLRNQNEDVRVAVASCISEITRITAPDAPYDDDLMKEVFQLIVSSFENLSDSSSHSYSKRTSILETVAKVRSCVVMLDLECDGLIIEMFQHFLKAIRDHQPEDVFSNMEIIMILVLEESEDVVLDLISPLLASLKKDNQEVQPIARKLAENVIEKCAAKIKPCLLEAKNSMRFSFDDYSTIVSTICMETNHIGQGNQKSPGEQLTEEGMADEATLRVSTQDDENKLSVPSSDEVPQGQVTKEGISETLEGESCHAQVHPGSVEDHAAPLEIDLGEDHPIPMEICPGEDNSLPVETCPEEKHSVALESGPEEALSAPATSPKSATGNGVAESENAEILAAPHTPEKPEHTNEEDRSHDDANVGEKAEPAYSDSEKVAKVESKSAQISKKRSKKPKHLMKPTVPSESSNTDTDTEKQSKQITDGDINLDKEVLASPVKNPSIKVSVHKDNDKEHEQLSSPKALESEPENVLSLSPSGNAFDEGRSRKDGRSKKKNKSSKKASPSEDVATKKETEGTDISEVMPRGRSGKKAPISDSPAEKAQVPIKTSKVEGGSGSDSDAKVVKKSGRKADIRDHTGGGTSSQKKKEDTRDHTGGSGSDSDAKVVKKSGRKADIRDHTGDGTPSKKKADTRDHTRGSRSDSDAKVVKKSGRKADTRDHTRDGTSSKKKVDDKKRVYEKEVIFPSKTSKVAKGVSLPEETPKTSSKRKRTPSKEKTIDAKKHGEDLVGVRIKVWWPMDKTFYEGVVDSFDSKTKKHKITYTDGENEHLNLGVERWELAEDGDSMDDGEQETRAATAEISPEMPKKKKAKSGSEPSAIEGKTESLRDVDASSGKSKGTATKSSSKSVNNSKNDGKLKEVTPKSSAKSEDVGGKSKVRSKKPGGKSTLDESEKADSSDDEGGGILKPIVKYKLGSPKTVSKDKLKTATKDKSKIDIKDSLKTAGKDSIRSGSKSNASKSGSKSSTNGNGKVKSGSTKSKETKKKEKSPGVVKALKSGKVKSAEFSQGKDTEDKSGKKRKRN